MSKYKHRYIGIIYIFFNPFLIINHKCQFFKIPSQMKSFDQLYYEILQNCHLIIY